MGMKSSMLGVIAMMSMMAEAPTMGRESAPRRRPEPAPRKQPTLEEMLEKMSEGKQLIQTRLEEYSAKRPKGKEFEVQGFIVKAINLKNAHNAVRKTLGEAGFRTDLTAKKYDLAILELERRIKERNDESKQMPD